MNVVELVPGLPAKVRAHPLSSGRALRSYQGTVEQLRSAVEPDDAWLRLVVREPQRAGLGQQVRDLFGDRVVEVRVESPQLDTVVAPSRQGRSPHELFAEYVASQGVDDPRVASLFAQLLDTEAAADAGEVVA